MKHTVRKIGLLLLLLGLLSTFCFAQTSEAALTGDGSAASPYLISDESGLRQLAADVNGGNSFSGSHFRLTGDLVLTESWTPIGTASTPFCGTFDGNGCTVSGMTGEGTYLGLFAHLGSGAVVENVHLTEVSLTGASYLAGIAAYADAGTGSITVSNCTVSGTLRDDAEDYPDGYLGGIIGYANAETGSLTVSDCSVSGSIYCDYRSGGILGYGEGASSRSIRILNCTNHAYIGAGNNGNSCGGIAGYLSYAVVERCMNYASVSGNAYSEDNGSSWLGGIVGEGGGVIFNGCGNYGDVSTFFAGGISPSQYGAHQANSCLNIGDMEHSSDGYGRAIIYSGSASNCYYLVGTGNGIDGATGVSSIEMESGAVAHALRDYFGQTLGVDPYPVPLTADNRVYEVTVIGEARGTFYVNGGDTVELPAVSDCTAYFDGEEKFDPSTPITRDYALAAKGYHNYVDGVCIYCGNEGVNYVDVGTCGASTAWVLTESGTLTISGSGAMLDYDGADAPWKAYGADIRSVIIGKGVTNIGNYAFSGLPNVTSVSIADTVTVIGDYAFYGYDGITDFTVGDNVTEIGEYAFAYWTGLTNLTLGSRLQTIGSHAFYMCSGLDYVEIPSSVTTVGSSAFRKCTALDYLYLRSGLAVIGDYAFSETAITSLNVPATVTAIGDYALADCSALELVTFLGAAPQIGANAFSGNTVRCELPNYDSSWDYNVQQNFGGTLTWSMGSGTCGSGLTWVLDFTGTLTVSGTGKMNSFDVYNGASQAPWGALAEKVRSVVIGEGVTSIGDYAFYGCTNLSSVSIADSVTEIGRESSFTGYGHGCVFYNCTSLTQITIPKNVRFIAPSSFAKCPGLMSIDVAYGNTSFSSEDGILYSRYKTELRCYPGGKGGAFTVPSSVTAITPYAFAYNEKLLSVTIPASVAEIEEYAFAYCYGLESVIFEGSAPTFGSYVFNGVTAEATCPASDTTWTLAVMKNCGSSLTWNVGSGACGTGVQWELIYSGVNTDLTVSGSGAMADYTSGTQPWAAYITNITSFTVEDGVTSVGAYILEKATALRRVTLADSVTSIGNSAFDHCTALWNVSLGNGIRTIGESAFYNTAITSMDFPDSLQSVDRYAFYYCTSLKTLTFGSGMQSIGYTAFASCTALQTVDLGSSLTTLEQSAFNGCSNLTKIVIPATVTTVGTYAFRNCTALQYVEFLGNAPTINTSAFGGTTCYAYYLASKSGWTSSVLTNYGGTVTWGALSQRGTCGSKTEWLLSAAGELYICGSGAINSYSEANPAPWDSFRANIKKISLRGVSSIGAYAFHGCGALTEAIVPSGVYSIGDYAFAGCEKLQVVLFEGSAPSFAANTFSGTACEMWYASAWSSSVCKDYGGTLTWRKTTSRGTSGSAVRWAMDSTGTLVLLGSGNMST